MGKSGLEPLGGEVLDFLWKRGTPEANGFFLSIGEILVADLRNKGLTLSLLEDFLLRVHCVFSYLHCGIPLKTFTPSGTRDLVHMLRGLSCKLVTDPV